MSNNISVAEFLAASNALLEHITNCLEFKDPQGLQINFDLYEDHVSIIASGKQYLVNRNISALQMWLVSPLSGPSHFYYDRSYWLNSRGINLLQLLGNELSTIIGTKIILDTNA